MGHLLRKINWYKNVLLDPGGVGNVPEAGSFENNNESSSIIKGLIYLTKCATIRFSTETLPHGVF
jgi:hypothetical protein